MFYVKNFIFLLSMKSLEKGQINFNSNQIHENNSREISWNLWFTKLILKIKINYKINPKINHLVKIESIRDTE